MLKYVAMKMGRERPMLSKPKHICCAEANSYRKKDYDQRNGVDLVHAALSHMADVDGNRVKTVRPMARACSGDALLRTKASPLSTHDQPQDGDSNGENYK